MWPALNLAGHWTSLSGPARARKPLLPVGITPLTNCRRGGLGVLSWKRLRSSITFRRSSRSRPYSQTLRFWVMHRRASFPAKHRLGLKEDATSLRAHLARSLWPPDGSLWGMLVDFSATTKFTTSAPYCARRARGEPSSAIRWMVSMTACTCTTLKSGFKFRISPVLGVRASEASDLPMLGYPLELVAGLIFIRGHHTDEVVDVCEASAGADPDLGIIVR
jgi:hypothetical protein